jgi:hypothetical protein
VDAVWGVGDAKGRGLPAELLNVRVDAPRGQRAKSHHRKRERCLRVVRARLWQPLGRRYPCGQSSARNQHFLHVSTRAGIRQGADDFETQALGEFDGRDFETQA